MNNEKQVVIEYNTTEVCLQQMIAGMVKDGMHSKKSVIAKVQSLDPSASSFKIVESINWLLENNVAWMPESTNETEFITTDPQLHPAILGKGRKVLMTEDQIKELEEENSF